MTDQRRLDLNSLLLAFESAIIELYDTQREDTSILDPVADAQINELKDKVERIRERILTFHDKWPNYNEDRLQLLNAVKDQMQLQSVLGLKE